MTMIIQAFRESEENETYKVNFSIMYNVNHHGTFTANQDAKFKFRDLVNLTHEQARSVAGLGNSLYEMGYAQAKKDIARKLGLL